MNLYRVAPYHSFLNIIADFIIAKLSNNVDQLKVVLPSGSACLNLQKILIEKQKISILPNIIPLDNLIAEGAEVFTIPTKNISVSTYLEEKIILAEIIFDYKELQLNISPSLNFSSKLAQLFYELIISDISIERIKNLPTVEQAEHWQTIYKFLEYAYEQWQQKITNLQKLDKAHYQISNIKVEIERLRNDKAVIIVAGIFGHNNLIWNFLKQIAELPTGYIILPPITNFNDQKISSCTQPREDVLYCLQKLLTVLNKNLSDFQHLGNIAAVSTLDKLIMPTIDLAHKPTFADNEVVCERGLIASISNKADINNIEYFEYESIFDEAEAISLMCLKHADNKKIAIIVNNEKTKELYCNRLRSAALIFDDLFGSSLSKTQEVHLIFSLSELVCNIFDLKKLLIFLKNPLIYSPSVVQFEQLLGSKNRFISNWQQLKELVTATKNQELIEWYENLQHLLGSDLYIQNYKFSNILQSIIIIAEKLYPQLWSKLDIHEFFSELINLNWHFVLPSLIDFPEILRSLIIEARSFAENNNSNLIICRPEDAALLKFDLVILTNFSEGEWPTSPTNNPWFSRQMQEELKLYSQQIRWGLSLYNFYLLLHNSHVVITRFKKQEGKSELLPSSYIKRLQILLDFFQNSTSVNDIVNRVTPTQVVERKPSSNVDDLSNVFTAATSDFFPDRLSATDIEILIRSPYSFYAKKILRLRKQESLANGPNLAEFGSFIHKIIEQYTKAYNNSLRAQDALSYILDISSNILANNILPMATKLVWRNKFAAFAEEFIEFDLNRRSDAKEIYAEIAGETFIETSNQKIKITTIADRIEVDTQGQLTIIDYKTGVVPTRKDILSGLSPQLIVESLIALDSGFNIANVKISNAPRIIYVKIASSKPYIKTTEIQLTSIELKEHCTGLQRLLNKYSSCKEFSSQLDLLKYNDYKNLTRNTKMVDINKTLR
ncbi:AddB family double-strand break repair helicase subunit B [Candidatus Trichorickettsia mobilis]|uniref:AddB family double-strand break repair helicase subunit B n=1 Tax=Candidatus Trichorickettsia mobilis TaxID=1346319 RepID=A0ABZ0UUT4_9RICK|nr:PD-(D/E)XK nuclease family protein [Candidatus Trichorickettsia mobilis]WPY00852.1 AddB family double-strand break repair helicase subunit B [Candidatus Trichorickettsia mobilis]